MLSFKLRKSSHDRFSKFAGWLCLLGWIGGILFTGYTGVGKYLEARAVLEDHVVIPAALELVDSSETYRRRTGTRTTYHFRYAFDFEGESHEGRLSVSESNIDKWIDRGTVDVAYSTTNHRFERLSIVEANNSILGMIGKALMFIFIMSILVLIVFIYLTAGLFRLHPDDQQLEDAAEDDGAEASAKA